MAQAQIRSTQGANAQIATPKHERIDKELLLLRNLPNQYKLGQKKTSLGRVIYLEIAKSALTLEQSIETFNFDILLRDKFPFQPPLIMTKTRFSNPSLADGRDLLRHLLPGDQTEWRPSMNLYEIIQQIPIFLSETIQKEQAAQKEEIRSLGRFHLGLNYDMLIWLSNAECRVFPCQQEVELQITQKGKKTGKVRKHMVDIYLVITEHNLMMLKTDTKIKNVAKLQAWGSLAAIQKINHSLTANDQITIYWRRVQDRKPWVLNVLMNQNSNDCISMIVKNLKRDNVTIKKEYEKKRMIQESEVTKNAIKQMKIESVLQTIQQFEKKMAEQVSQSTAQHLIALYNKAVEYYSALDDERHLEYLMKLQTLLKDEALQQVMEVSDVGTVDPQSNASTSSRLSQLEEEEKVGTAIN